MTEIVRIYLESLVETELFKRPRLNKMDEGDESTSEWEVVHVRAVAQTSTTQRLKSFPSLEHWSIPCSPIRKQKSSVIFMAVNIYRHGSEPI